MGVRDWRFWLFIALLVLLQLALHLGLGLGATAPDLLTVAVLIAARRLPVAGAALLGLGLGLLQDSLSLTAFGAESVTLVVLGYLGARSRDFVLGEGVLFMAVYLFVGKWLHDVLFLLFSRIGFGADVTARLLVQAPLAAAYATLCGSLALILYRTAVDER